MRILGVDPGLRRCGWGVIDARAGRAGFVACGVIAPDTDAPLAERLAAIHRGISEVIAMNHLLKYSGVNPAERFNDRLMSQMRQKTDVRRYLQEDNE